MAEVSDAVKRDKLKARASYVGAAINVLQTLIKIGFGILGQSAALIADGIHSLSDLLSDLLVIIAVKLGSREADHDHPYGHRRFETIATVILGVSLIGDRRRYRLVGHGAHGGSRASAGAQHVVIGRCGAFNSD